MKSVNRMWKVELQDEVKYRRKQLDQINRILSKGLWHIIRNYKTLLHLSKTDNYNID